MRIFSSVEMDSEMRIAAYRAMIRCPSEQLLEGIATVMATEPTHQGSVKHVTSNYTFNHPNHVKYQLFCPK